MLGKIRAVLVEVGQTFKDKRVQYCDVDVSELVQERCVLTGAVLDVETLTAVTTHLHSRFPGITFDVTDVHILRQPDNPVLTVQTNLAGLHSQPQRTSEQVSQLLNGVLLEKLLQEGDWLYVRQADGYLGWVYALYVGVQPPVEAAHLVGVPVAHLHLEPDTQAGLVSRVLGGTAVSVINHAGEWSQITLAGGKTGWLRTAALRPTADLPEDENGRRQQIVADALPYIGVPYVWGGTSAHGIDCSGLSQLLYHLVGVTLPRDADMQFNAGKPIDTPFQPGDLLFFGREKGHRAVTHVGISLGGWQMIHSSGPRNGVYIDDVQAVDWLRDSFLGARTFL